MLKRSNKVMIAAHRGVAGGNIPCNTLPAFEAALLQGSDILEMDVIRSLDGELMIFHNGLEPIFLGSKFDIYQKTKAEILDIPVRNGDSNETLLRLSSFDEVLEQFKNRCLINLDRCWDLWEYVLPAVKRHGMTEQVILKSPPLPKYFQQLADIGPEFAYMPIMRGELCAMDELEQAKIYHYGTELVFFTEDAPILSEESLSRLRKGGKLLWGNAILYSYRAPLAAGHSDDISVVGRADEGWGWLADKGFDIIQTDWPGMLCQYLHHRGLHSAPPLA